MISQKLLTAKGTIEALIALSRTDTLTTSQLSAEMDVAEGTARERLGELRDVGLVTEDADLHDDRPVRVYAVTNDGEQLANSLASILDGYGADAARHEATDEAPEDTTDSEETA